MMEKRYENACFDLQVSVDEALSVLSRLLDTIEGDGTDQASPEIADMMQQQRMKESYLPALRVIEAHLNAASDRALRVLEPQQ